jgi:hypothetical protein
MLAVDTDLMCSHVYPLVVSSRPQCSHSRSSTLILDLRLLLLLRHQIPQREIIHDILHILDPVLQPVAAAAQAVVLEVEDLETSMQVLDKLVDEQWTLVIT